LCEKPNLAERWGGLVFGLDISLYSLKQELTFTSTFFKAPYFPPVSRIYDLLMWTYLYISHL